MWSFELMVNIQLSLDAVKVRDVIDQLNAAGWTLVATQVATGSSSIQTGPVELRLQVSPVKISPPAPSKALRSNLELP